MNPRRRDMLVWIQWFTDKNGFAPTQAEIAEAFGIAQPNVYHNLNVLTQLGYIKREPFKTWRNIKVVRIPERKAA